MYEEQDEFEEEPEMNAIAIKTVAAGIIALPDNPSPDAVITIAGPATVRVTPPSPRGEALTALRSELARLDADLNTKYRQREELAELIVLLAQGRVTAKEALAKVQ